MSEEKDTERDKGLGLKTNQVMAGALAAATAAVLGSTLGVAGTVLGATVASLVTTVGSAVYQRSLERTTEGVRTIRTKVVTRAGSTVVETTPEPEEPTPPRGRRLRPAALLAAVVVAFALGMGLVTGLEWLRGTSLTGTEGTTVGGLIAPRPNPHPVPPTADPTPTRTERPPFAPPSSTPTSTPTPTNPTPTPTTTTTTTTAPPSSSTPTTPQPTPTTTPPPTTTSAPPPPSAPTVTPPR